MARQTCISHISTHKSSIFQAVVTPQQARADSKLMMLLARRAPNAAAATPTSMQNPRPSVACVRAPVAALSPCGGGLSAAARSLSCSGQQAAARAGRAAVVAAAAPYQKDVTGLSSLRFAQPTLSEMQQLQQEFTSRDINHEFAGASANAPDLPDAITSGGFIITKTRRQVGSGQAAYAAAVAAVKSWAHIQLGWNCTTTPIPLQVSATVCSATQTVVPWSVLPARITFVTEGPASLEGGKGKRFAVGMASLQGHQLAGEERFAVEMLADGSVFYDVFLFSKPDTLLALLSLPVVKIQQLRYVSDSATAVARAVAGST